MFALMVGAPSAPADPSSLPLQLGEGVPDSKKGMFPTHSTAIGKFLKGFVKY